MTSWTADKAMQAPGLKLTAYVVEAAGGMFRTVMGSMNANELHVVLTPDNPLCALLAGDGALRVMAADGRAFGARSAAGGSQAVAGETLALLQERRSGQHPAPDTARTYRLVLDPVAGEERGQSPRT